MNLRILVLPLLILASAGGKLAASERPIVYQCAGLETYDIRGSFDTDWGCGTIRARTGDFVIGFSVGPTVAELVPADRPAGFATFKVERLGNVALRYGYHARLREMQATLVGAPVNRFVNLTGPRKHRKELLTIARILADAPCKFLIDR